MKTMAKAATKRLRGEDLRSIMSMRPMYDGLAVHIITLRTIIIPDDDVDLFGKVNRIPWAAEQKPRRAREMCIIGQDDESGETHREA